MQIMKKKYGNSINIHTLHYTIHLHLLIMHISIQSTLHLSEMFVLPCIVVNPAAIHIAIPAEVL